MLKSDTNMSGTNILDSQTSPETKAEDSADKLLKDAVAAFHNDISFYTHPYGQRELPPEDRFEMLKNIILFINQRYDELTEVVNFLIDEIESEENTVIGKSELVKKLQELPNKFRNTVIFRMASCLNFTERDYTYLQSRLVDQLTEEIREIDSKVNKKSQKLTTSGNITLQYSVSPLNEHEIKSLLKRKAKLQNKIDQVQRLFNLGVFKRDHEMTNETDVDLSQSSLATLLEFLSEGEFNIDRATLGLKDHTGDFVLSMLMFISMTLCMYSGAVPTLTEMPGIPPVLLVFSMWVGSIEIKNRYMYYYYLRMIQEYFPHLIDLLQQFDEQNLDKPKNQLQDLINEDVEEKPKSFQVGDDGELPDDAEFFGSIQEG